MAMSREPGTDRTTTGHPPAGCTRVVILGAAGRDFHDFNVVFRDERDRASTPSRTYAPTH